MNNLNNSHLWFRSICLLVKYLYHQWQGANFGAPFICASYFFRRFNNIFFPLLFWIHSTDLLSNARGNCIYARSLPLNYGILTFRRVVRVIFTHVFLFESILLIEMKMNSSFKFNVLFLERDTCICIAFKYLMIPNHRFKFKECVKFDEFTLIMKK